MPRPPQNASPFSQKLAAAATARGSPSRASRDFALQNPPPGTEPENRFRSPVAESNAQTARSRSAPAPSAPAVSRVFRPDQRRLLQQTAFIRVPPGNFHP